MLTYDKVAYAKWQERYDPMLRVAVENGVAYLTPKLVGEFEGSNIDVIFTGSLASSKEGKYLDAFYREPHIDEKMGLPISPAIFISEKERPTEKFHTRKEL